MNNSGSQKVELLAPAGNFEKLVIALHYGADAVYLSGKAFSLRNFSGNFSLDEIKAAVDLAHDHGAKIYVAVNIFARSQDLSPLETYLTQLNAIAPDGIIVADPGVLSLARRMAPDIPLHLSTQANTTNIESARFWQTQGVRRINAARELSLDEIALLANESNMEIEAFVHGAMCISYSGRCLLSNYMARRSSNRGMCCQPCRFQYAVLEATRPGQYFPISEDHRGTYIFNSKDLCMLNHLPDMIRSKIRSLKIEGRMKGIHYTATAVKVYREAIDSYFQDPAGYTVKAYWRQELEKITSRGYCTGFYLSDPHETIPSFSPSLPPTHALAGKVLAPAGPRKAHIEVRNQLRKGDDLEILKPLGPPIPDMIRQIEDKEGQLVDIAQPGNRVTIQVTNDCQRLDLLRLKTVVAPNDA